MLSLMLVAIPLFLDMLLIIMRRDSFHLHPKCEERYHDGSDSEYMILCGMVQASELIRVSHYQVKL